MFLKHRVMINSGEQATSRSLNDYSSDWEVARPSISTTIQMSIKAYYLLLITIAM